METKLKMSRKAKRFLVYIREVNQGGRHSRNNKKVGKETFGVKNI